MEEHHCRYYGLPYALWPCLMTIRGTINRKRSFLDITMHTNTPKVHLSSFFQGFMNIFSCKSMHHSTLWWLFSTPFACKNSFEGLRTVLLQAWFYWGAAAFNASHDTRSQEWTMHRAHLMKMDVPHKFSCTWDWGKRITAMRERHILFAVPPVSSLRGPQFLSCRWHGTSNILPRCFYHFHQCI